MSKTYQEEQNDLLRAVLANYDSYFKKSAQWQFDNCLKNNSRDMNYELEFFITNKCNQNCGYCYLTKNDLYPEEALNEDIILNNLKLLLDYYSKIGWSFGNLNLFSGEILGTNFSFKILNILLEYISTSKIKIKRIIIPSNFSFILNDKITNKLQRYFEEFRKYDTFIALSLSNDGFYVDKSSRPFKNLDKTKELKTEEYYNKLIDFCAQNYFCFHPMIAAQDLDYWKENYKWWYEQIEKYPDIYKNIFQATMFLEVRNNFWDTKSILKYLDFINFMVDYDIEKFWLPKNEMTLLYSKLMCIPYNNTNIQEEKNKQYNLDNYIPYNVISNCYKPGCSATNVLSIRLGDLAIVPCHRTSYDKFLYGYYEVKNNQITGIKGKNVNLAYRILKQEWDSSPVCGNCSIYGYCPLGCYGSQYENSGEILYPCDTVCQLEKAKFLFSYLKGKQILEKYSKNINIKELQYQENDKIKNICNTLMETEEGRLWHQMFYSMNS